MAKSQTTRVADQILQASATFQQQAQIKTDTGVSSVPQVCSILDYIEKPWGVQVDLYPVQRFIVKLYYGIELSTKLPSNPKDRIRVYNGLGKGVKYELSEAEYCRYLYEDGRCNIAEPDHDRRELLLALGRRAGKSTLSSIFASYEIYKLLSMYNPQNYYSLVEGADIQITSVAVNKEQAAILFRAVMGHIHKCDFFSQYLVSDTQSRTLFRTPFEIEKFGPINRSRNGKFVSMNGKASIRLTFKPCVGATQRGFNNILIIMDEVAHFQDKGGASAMEVYTALEPSTIKFTHYNQTTQEFDPEGRIILISSPMARTGLFYQRFDQAIRGGVAGSNILAIRAPSWEINPTISHKDLIRKQHENPVSFAVEYGAEFSDQVKGWIENESLLLECCQDPGFRPIRSALRGQFQMGIDVGLGREDGEGDGTAIAITYVTPTGEIALAYHEYWVAGKSWAETNPHLDQPPLEYAKLLQDQQRLDFDSIAEWIKVLTNRFPISSGVFDQWNGLPLEQALQKKGLRQFTCEKFPAELRSRMYQTFKLYMVDGKLKLYDWPLPTDVADGRNRHSALIAELLSLQASYRSRHITEVFAPEIKGAHDDMSDALCRSIWLSSQRLGLGHNPSTQTSRPYAAGQSRAGFLAARQRAHGASPRPNSRREAFMAKALSKVRGGGGRFGR